MLRRGRSCATIAFVLAVLGGACSLAIDTSDLSRAAPPSNEGGAPPATPDADAVGPLEDAGVEDAGVEDAGVGDAGVEDCATADLMTNPRHCGRCGRDCAGGQCMGGRCTPVVLLRDLGYVVGVAVAGDAVYVGAYDRAKILRVGVDGGGAVEVAGPTRANYMAASATHLYWTDGSSVLRWPFEGGPIERIVSNVPAAEGVALGPNHVYFARYTTNGGVERALLDGGSRETVIAPYDKPEDIDFANGELFVAGADGENELAAFANDGFGPKRVLSRGGVPVAMAVWGADVFFVQQGDDTLRRVPIAGGSVEWLADTGGFPCGVAVNADFIFWVTCGGDGRLYRLVR
jgi:hypothetical protein